MATMANRMVSTVCPRARTETKPNTVTGALGVTAMMPKMIKSHRESTRRKRGVPVVAVLAVASAKFTTFSNAHNRRAAVCVEASSASSYGAADPANRSFSSVT
jgi:hypothetical protein